jgi:predicted nucleic acid-binding protein
MFLLDTSAWIESFRKKSKFQINKHFRPEEIRICLPVYQEILQGIGDDSSYTEVKKALDSAKFLEENLNQTIFEDAISIYRQARKKGITIRSSIDCLISAIAIKHNATVVHLDRDYSQISQFTLLKEKRITNLYGTKI